MIFVHSVTELFRFFIGSDYFRYCFRYRFFLLFKAISMKSINKNTGNKRNCGRGICAKPSCKAHIYSHIGQKAGEVLTDQDLIPAEISQDLFPADAITEPSSVMGKVIRCDISKNTALTCSLLYDEKDYPDDMRLVEYTAITIPQKLEPLEYADIRIMFPNGLDYIVLSKKQIKDIQRQSAENPKNIIWFHSNEEEILRMASAIVDANLVEGTKLYAVPYVAPEIQGEAVRTYPSNPEVLDLILQNPNIVKKAVTELEIRNRAMFEDRINKDFQNSGRNKVFSDNTDSITISPVVNSEDIEVEAGTRLEDKL